MKPPIYKTERFFLKPYEKADEDKFIEIMLDPATVEFMGDSKSSESRERKLFQNIFQIYKNNDDKKRWFWIWGVYKNGKLVAHFELKETEHTSPFELEIVYAVHPFERKKGIMSEILSFIKTNQKTWKRKIIATVDQQNQASISLLEKWGIEKKELVKDLETNEEYFKIWLK